MNNQLTEALNKITNHELSYQSLLEEFGLFKESHLKLEEKTLRKRSKINLLKEVKKNFLRIFLIFFKEQKNLVEQTELQKLELSEELRRKQLALHTKFDRWAALLCLTIALVTALIIYGIKR